MINRVIGGRVLRLAVVANGRTITAFGKTPPQLETDLFIERAGMRLLLVHAQLGEQLEYDAGFNFKLPRQLIDPNFTHRRDC